MVTRKGAKERAKNGSQIAKPASGLNGSLAVKVRMYRQGLGDCFLITLPRKDNTPNFILIDCGVIIGTPDGATKMKEVVSDIVATTKGHIDLLLATHEHWDHLSAFVQAKDLFAKLRVDKVWLAWTENPADPLARELKSKHHALRMALASACARMRFGGSGDSTTDNLLQLFSAGAQGTTGDALKSVKDLCKASRFCLPKDEPQKLEGSDVRLYVLGPPYDEKMINKYDPSKKYPETYGMAAMFIDMMAPAITDAEAPFDPIVQIPVEVARQIPFFQAHYWGEDPDARKEETSVADKEAMGSKSDKEMDQSWRRIDGDWLDIMSDLALQLDSATNNTSLVLAIELEDGDVLLFAADAQVGNWLSWQDLSWKVDGKTVTGPDLLGRTILYKTGHHGSHNATLREKGLEMMKNLKIALIPVDHDEAVKKHWDKMPMDELVKRLNEITKGCVLRIDRDVPPELAGRVKQDESQRLYYEVTV